MTRRRFIRLVMSQRIQRNEAHAAAKVMQAYSVPYDVGLEAVALILLRKRMREEAEAALTASEPGAFHSRPDVLMPVRYSKTLSVS